MFSLSEKEIKAILQIEETDYDEYIESVLPSTITFVEKYCNREFAMRNADGKLEKNNNGYIINEEGIVVAIAKIIEYFMNRSGVTQEMISRSITMFSADLPKSITTILNSYRRVRFV